MAAISLRTLVIAATAVLVGCSSSTTPQGMLSTSVTVTPSTVARGGTVQFGLRVRNGTTRDAVFSVDEFAVFRVGRTQPVLTGEIEGEGLHDVIRLAPGETIEEPAGALVVDERFDPGQYELWIYFSGIQTAARGSFSVQ